MAVKEETKEKTTPKMKGVSRKKTTKDSEKNLKIELVRSLIGHPQNQREVVKGLGLRRINSKVVRKDSPEIWGMIRKVSHLVKVEVIKGK